MLTPEDKQWIATAIDERLAASEERMRVHVEKVETTLLTEFHKWAEPVASRL